jgi:hypothetical protein
LPSNCRANTTWSEEEWGEGGGGQTNLHESYGEAKNAQVTRQRRNARFFLSVKLLLLQVTALLFLGNKCEHAMRAQRMHHEYTAHLCCAAPPFGKRR